MGKVGGVVGLVAAAVLCVGVFARSGSPAPSEQRSQDFAQLDEIVVQPPREKCSKLGASCVSTKCCKISGYNCFEKKPGDAACMKSCIPGVNGTCLMPGSLVPLKPAVGLVAVVLLCVGMLARSGGAPQDNSVLKEYYSLSTWTTPAAPRNSTT